MNAENTTRVVPPKTDSDKWLLRLYVAGQTPKAIISYANLKKICEEYLGGRYQIEVIDLLVNPTLAKDDQILALPTLVRKLPEPVKKIIGDLSNTERVLLGLDIRRFFKILDIWDANMSKNTDAEAPSIKDALAAFELALQETDQGRYVLRLYVSGMTPNSQRAIENVRKICEEHLQGRFELEIIDIYQQPIFAKEGQIVAVPTLVKELPPPLRKFIGDLSQTERILAGLDLRKKD